MWMWSMLAIGNEENHSNTAINHPTTVCKTSAKNVRTNGMNENRKNAKAQQSTTYTAGMAMKLVRKK